MELYTASELKEKNKNFKNKTSLNTEMNYYLLEHNNMKKPNKKFNINDFTEGCEDFIANLTREEFKSLTILLKRAINTVE